MNNICSVCKGACCETIIVSPRQWGWSDDEIHWVELHGNLENGCVRMFCPCRNLVNGVCAAYEDRPKMCDDYVVGSGSCKEAIRLLRSETTQKVLFYMMDE